MDFHTILTYIIELLPLCLSLCTFVVGLIALIANKKTSLDTLKNYINEMLPEVLNIVELSGMTGSTNKKELALSSVIQGLTEKFKLNSRTVANLTKYTSQQIEKILSTPTIK